MSNIKLGNGGALKAFLSGSHPTTRCDCKGSDVGAVLKAMGMAGSNLYNLYPGKRCSHGEPIKAGPVAYIVHNFKEEAIKIEGKSNVKGWLEHVMKGSVALVFFRDSKEKAASTLDLYLTNKLWMNSGVADEADEMWVWIIGGSVKKAPSHKHHSKSHHKPVPIF